MIYEEHRGNCRNGGNGRREHPDHDKGHSRGFGLRYWVLSIVSGEPSTGAMIMDKIEGVSMGNWRPSPGHIYPLLESLVANGDLLVENRDGKKYYTITEQGKMVIEENWFPWRTMGGMSGFNGLEDAIGNIEAISNYIVDNRERVAENTALRNRLKTAVDRLEEI
ncbi:MAG: PadR family transcriptional regulator [Thermoplasmata archaeon]